MDNNIHLVRDNDTPNRDILASFTDNSIAELYVAHFSSNDLYIESVSTDTPGIIASLLGHSQISITIDSTGYIGSPQVRSILAEIEGTDVRNNKQLRTEQDEICSFWGEMDGSTVLTWVGYAPDIDSATERMLEYRDAYMAENDTWPTLGRKEVLPLPERKSKYHN